MIRGPVLPQSRDALWALVATRLDVIERGLTLCCEAVDCSEGRFGVVDGLARDGKGAPVLVLTVSDDDVMLVSRALAAADFLQRVGDGLAAAAPEAALCPGETGRVLAIGGPAGAASLELLRRMVVPGLEVCRLEAFRIGGSERFAVRRLASVATGRVPSVVPLSEEPVVEFEVPPARRGEWQAVQGLCERIDSAIRMDGGRFQRRITWHGRELGEVVANDGDLLALDAKGEHQSLVGGREVRVFGDRLLRRYLHASGVVRPETVQSPKPPAERPGAARAASPTESLREALGASRLSPEEYSALGSPTSVATAEHDSSNTADYVVRMVGEPDGSWPLKPTE